MGNCPNQAKFERFCKSSVKTYAGAYSNIRIVNTGFSVEGGKEVIPCHYR